MMPQWCANILGLMLVQEYEADAALRLCSSMLMLMLPHRQELISIDLIQGKRIRKNRKTKTEQQQR